MGFKLRIVKREPFPSTTVLRVQTLDMSASLTVGLHDGPHIWEFTALTDIWVAQNGDQVTLQELRQIYDEYTYVRDKIVETMHDPDDWDGDSSEGYILGEYVKWLADGKPEDRPAL